MGGPSHVGLRTCIKYLWIMSDEEVESSTKLKYDDTEEMKETNLIQPFQYFLPSFFLALVWVLLCMFATWFLQHPPLCLDSSRDKLIQNLKRLIWQLSLSNTCNTKVIIKSSSSISNAPKPSAVYGFCLALRSKASHSDTYLSTALISLIEYRSILLLFARSQKKKSSLQLGKKSF